MNVGAGGLVEELRITRRGRVFSGIELDFMKIDAKIGGGYRSKTSLTRTFPKRNFVVQMLWE